MNKAKQSYWWELPLWIRYLIPQKMLDSTFYYHIYYKHTKGCKDDLAAIRSRVINRGKQIIEKMDNTPL